MPFAIDGQYLLAYEDYAEGMTLQPTISAQLLAGWVCPNCGELLRAIAGPWSGNTRWWSYDTTNGHGRDHRPASPGRAAKYRGGFDSNGGYLYSFSHKRPLSYVTSDGRSYPCDLGVSLRLGVAGGVASLDSIPAHARDRLTAVILSGKPLKHVRLIPDVLGMRESIIAMPANAAYKWHQASANLYDERRVQAWDSFIEELLVEKQTESVSS